MIRGTKRALDKQPSAVNVDLKASIHNRFDIEVVDAKTGEVKQRAQAFNVVCDNLWNRLFTLPSTSRVSEWSKYLVYGTGTGTPSASDASLFSYLGNKSVSSVHAVNYDARTGVYSLTKKAQILETEQVGATITEVGLAYSTSSGGLCTHAMLQDMNGNQISILKTGTDIINLYSTVFVHMNPAKDNGVQLLPVLVDKNGKWEEKHIASLLAGVAVSSTDSEYIRFFATPNVYTNQDIKPGSPSMSADPATKTWTFGPVRLAAGTGNIGGIYGVGLSMRTSYNYNNYSIPFVALFAGDGEWFPGSDVVGEAVGTGDGATTEFALKFPYATEGKVYVDGVEATGVIIRNCPKSADTAQVMQMIDSRSTVDNIIPFITKAGELTESTWEANKPGITAYTSAEGAYLYNPLWEYGIERFNFYYARYAEIVEFSDDMVNWEQMQITENGTNTDYFVPENLKHKKFLHIKASASPLASSNNNGVFFPSDMPTKAVLFDAPPAAGAVITADYHTPVIAKDENHVFDLTVTFQFGEYTEN